MSKINLKAFSGKIYSFLSPYIDEYISNEISKESFIQMMNEGTLSFDTIQTKDTKTITLFEMINVNSVRASKIEIKMPNEAQNLSMSIGDITVNASIKELNDDDIANMINKEYNNLSGEFIKYAVDTVEKSKGSLLGDLSFIADIFIKNLIQNFHLDIDNVKIFLNDKFLFSISNVHVKNSDEFAFDVNNISASVETISIIEHLGIKGKMTAGEDKKYNCSVNIDNGINVDINAKIFKAIDTLKNEFIKNYKKIKEYKNKLKEEGTKMNIEQEKQIADEFYEGKTNNKIGIIDKIQFLEYSKEKTQKQLIDNKKNNKGKKLFSFFLGGGDKDDQSKNELNEEETKTLNEIYTKENINNFIKGKIEIKTKNPIKDKALSFISSIKESSLLISQIKISLINNNNNVSLLISNLMSSYTSNDTVKLSTISINDIFVIHNNINYNLITKESNDNAFTLTIDNNFNLTPSLNFEEIVINDCYIKSIKDFISLLSFFDFKSITDEMEPIDSNQYKEKINKVLALGKGKTFSLPIVSFNTEKNKIAFWVNEITTIQSENDFIKFSFKIEIRELTKGVIILSNSSFTISINKDNEVDIKANTMNVTINKEYMTTITELIKQNEPSDKNKSNFDIVLKCSIEYLNLEYDEVICRSNVIASGIGIEIGKEEIISKIDSIEIVTNNKSPLFLSFVTFLLMYDPNANDPNKKMIEQYKNSELNEVFPPNDSKDETKKEKPFNLLCNKFNFTVQSSINSVSFLFLSLEFSLNPQEMKILTKSSKFISKHIKDSNDSFTLYDSKSSLSIEYNLKTNHFNMNIPNPTLIYNTDTLQDVIEVFTLDIVIDIVIVDFIFNVVFTNLKIKIDRFNVIIQEITIQNFKENVNLIKILCSNLTMQKILYSQNEKNIRNKTEFTIAHEDKCEITIDNKTKIYISHSVMNVIVTPEDLRNFLLSIDFKKMNESSYKNDIDLFQLSDKSSLKEYKFNMNIPEISLKLYFREMEKIAEISLQEINLFLNMLANNTNITSNTNLSIKQINLNYFDSQNLQYLLLSSNQELLEENNTQEGNQVEFSKTFDLIHITITSMRILIRLDAFLFLYYYFQIAIPFEAIYDKVKDIKPEIQIKIDFNNSTFLLQTSFDLSEMLSLSISNMTMMYQNVKGEKFPFGKFFTQISIIESKFETYNRKRDFFKTLQDFMVLSIELPPHQSLLRFSVDLGEFFVNLAYSDFISLLKSFELNKFYIEKERRADLMTFLHSIFDETLIDESQDKKPKMEIEGQFQWNRMDITLIDNSDKNFYPFMKIIFDTIDTTITRNFFQGSLKLMVNSFNYIARVWEPNIESTLITFEYEEGVIKKTKNINFNLNNDILLLNISDMNLSFVLKYLTNWLDKFFKEQSKTKVFFADITNKKEEKLFNMNLKKNKSSFLQMSSMVKDDDKYGVISNNNLINVTGETFEISYKKTTKQCPPDSRTFIEYYNDSANKRKALITLKYKGKSFDIPIEKFGSRIHRINEDDFFISEISLSKNRTIDISIYPQIIISNRTHEILTIVCVAQEQEDFYLILSPDEKKGIPFDYLTGVFYFLSEGNENTFAFSEILNTNINGIYQKNVEFVKDKIALMKLVRDIPNVRTLEILFEYSVVNCLPWKIFIRLMSRKDKVIEIEKCTQMDIVFNKNCKMLFEMQINGDLYSTDYDYFFCIDQPYLVFKNYKGEKFCLPYLYSIKNKKNELILYAEYLIKNASELEDINLISKDKNGYSIILKVNNDLFFFPSNVNLDTKFKIQYKQIFISDSIQVKSLLEGTSPVVLSSMSTDLFYNLQINCAISYITIQNYPSFSETISSMIFSIMPICHLYNFLPGKSIILHTITNKNEEEVVTPMKKKCFHFFGCGRNKRLLLKVIPSSSKDEQYINFASVGKQTFFIDDFFLNVEIRENNYINVIEVYFSEADVETANVVIENKSNFVIALSQEGFEDNFQIFEKNQKDICKLYSQFDPIINVMTDNMSYKITLNDIKDRKDVCLNKKLIVSSDSNGIKRSITFYNTEDYYQIKPQNKITNFSFKFNQILVTVIGDNEFTNKKLRKYDRKELMLLVFDGVDISINKNKNLNLLNSLFTLEILIKDFHICNQFSKYGKFSIVFYNSTRPFFSLKTKFENFSDDKISKIKEVAFNFSKMTIGIDPNFVYEIINFYKNVIYRIDLIDFNVDEIFLNKKQIRQNLIDQNQIFNNYLIQGSNIKIPELVFSFEISKIDLNKLLKEHFQCSSFYCFLISNLSGKSHTITLSNNVLKGFIGTIDQLFLKIMNTYQFELFAQMTAIGLKGFALSVVNWFKKEEKVSDKVIVNQNRKPRVFYGRFKFIQNYNTEQAVIYKSITNNYNFFDNNYFFINSITGVYYIFVFTTLSMFVFSKQFENLGNFDYFYIKEAIGRENKIVINYNQMIDGITHYELDCKEKDIAKKVAKMLNEEKEKYEDEILNLE